MDVTNELTAAAPVLLSGIERAFDDAAAEGEKVNPSIAIVTGSGLGGLVDVCEVGDSMGFDQIPGLGSGTVAGHSSQWHLGRIAGVPVHVVAGRRHLYEGIDPAQTIFAVRLMAKVGVRLVILSNAAGGLARNFVPGDLMLLRDQINLSFRNPLIGPNHEEIGPRFPDMSAPFCPMAKAMLRRAALRESIDLKEGIYAGVMGPNYETRAEIAMLRRFGAHAVGMSTVHETLAANHAGVHVVGISLITNSCSEVGPEAGSKTTHEEVLEAASAGQGRFNRLIASALPLLGRLIESPAFRQKDLTMLDPQPS